jgi:lysophospholipase L1-like esterase
MAYYPVNELDKVPEGEWGRMAFVNRTNENITKANQRVEKLAQKLHYHFINVNEGLADENGRLKKEYTVEGIHMYANAYQLILQNMMPYLG